MTNRHQTNTLYKEENVIFIDSGWGTLYITVRLLQIKPFQDMKRSEQETDSLGGWSEG